MKPLVLIILDGWGMRAESAHNAIALAKKPNFDRYWHHYPHCLLDASGPAVGLPQGIMGNSEVGHMNMGAGRVVYTGLSQVYQAIGDQSFFKNKALLQACDAAKKHDAALHLMGLVSDGAVHSHQDHLYALLELAKRRDLSRVFVHCFTDGRDTPPFDGSQHIQKLQEKMDGMGLGKIASVSGRYYAMDRDQRWERIDRAFEVMTGKNQEGASSAGQIVEKSYSEGKGDEFIEPKAVLDEQGKPVGPVCNNDAVIFFNFRADRARQMTRRFVENGPKLSAFVCMAPFDNNFDLPVAFRPQTPKRVFAEIISEEGLRQLRIAETEKYAHVTFFFNGGVDKIYAKEERILVPSPRDVATYDQKPEMSAMTVTDVVMRKLDADSFDVVILNFANTDMVGHTAVLPAIIRAVETVDVCLGRVVESVLAKKGCVLVTADHGNAEETVDEQGRPHTAHTTNLVPFMLVCDALKNIQLQEAPGQLCDVAPTMLKILEIKKPKEMTGVSLF